MATNVIFTRGNTATINATAITDGQILYNTTTGNQYLDNGTTRIQVGQNITVDAVLNSSSSNPIANSGVAGVILPSLSEISTVTQAGSLPDALAIKALNSNLGTLTFAQNTDGKWGYKVAGADPVIPFNKGLELLWTNPSPASAFAAQAVSIDLSKYKYIAIDSTYSYAFASTNNYRSICIQPVPSQTSGTGISKIIVAFDNQGSGSNRDTTISTTRITFSSGKRLLSGQVFDDSDGYCVPLRIYGIADIT